jgi:integrase
MYYLEPSDLAKVFRAAYEMKTLKSRLHHLAMLTQFYSGTRVSQLLALRGEDVCQLDEKWVVLVPAAKRGNKVVRALHVSPDPAFDMTPLIEIARVKRISKLFEGLSRDYYNQVIEKACVAAGIHTDFAHSHMLRHSCAVAIFDATQRIGAVTEFLAHKSATAAMVYLREADGARAQNAMDNLQLV